MTDLRSVTIIALMGRLLAHIDRGDNIAPTEIKQAIVDGAILELLRKRLGDYPEFSPIHAAEAVLLLHELRIIVDDLAGREASKLGMENNGLCILSGHCLELLMRRNIKELTK